MDGNPAFSDNSGSVAQGWLSQRLRPGNWLDIDPREEIPPEITGWSRTLVHMHQICFSPEIRRRKAAGELGEDFLLWAAQLLQPRDGTRVIRFNQEIRGVPYIRTGRPLEKGGQITLSDLAGLEYFDLEDDELDCGHFTIFWTESTWIGTFDFRAGRAKCLSLIEKALRYVAATRLALREGIAEPALDNLHTACELLAKTRLILSHAPAQKWKTHRTVSSAINKEGKLGNIDPAFLALFNRLSDIRSHVKYATGYETALPSCDEVDLAESMALGLKRAVAQRRPD